MGYARPDLALLCQKMVKLRCWGRQADSLLMVRWSSFCKTRERNLWWKVINFSQGYLSKQLVRDRAQKVTLRDEMPRVASLKFPRTAFSCLMWFARSIVCQCSRTEDKFLELDIMQDAKSNTEGKTLNLSPVKKTNFVLSFMIINCLMFKMCPLPPCFKQVLLQSTLKIQKKP